MDLSKMQPLFLKKLWRRQTSCGMIISGGAFF